MANLRPMVLMVSIALACLGWGPASHAVAAPHDTLVLATTTSVQDSGLLEVLVPPFEQAAGVKVRVLAVGTGQALQIGRRGDADALLVHAPGLEKKFMNEGHGVARRSFMYNDFVLLGPAADPARVHGMKSVVEAFRAIAEARCRFVSRGDGSGTHVKEQTIWKAARVAPGGDWYLEGGSGMAATLRLASERDAYTLSDRATFLVWRDKLALRTLLEGDPLLRNIYSVIVVNPKKHPGVRVSLARQFADYLFSKRAREIIRGFGRRKFGEPLFAVLPEPKPTPEPR